jgi:hypothetical protein
VRSWQQRGRRVEGSHSTWSRRRDATRSGEADGEIFDVKVVVSTADKDLASWLSAQNQTQASTKSCQRDVRGKRKKNGNRGGRGERGFYRNGRQSLSVTAKSRASLRPALRPCREIGRGEIERRAVASYRCRHAMNLAAGLNRGWR